MAILLRTRDGAGDAGRMTLALDWTEEDGLVVKGNRPMVGYAVRVGAARATMFGADTYWTTTRVTEILEECENYVRFKTGNSEYEWWADKDRNDFGE